MPGATELTTWPESYWRASVGRSQHSFLLADPLDDFILLISTSLCPFWSGTQRPFASREQHWGVCKEFSAEREFLAAHRGHSEVHPHHTFIDSSNSVFEDIVQRCHSYGGNGQVALI